MSFSESDFIRWCTADTPQGDLLLGPGDDAAVLADGSVLSVDACVEGTHFEPGESLAAVAHKAIGSALSDVCAMGALPELILLSAQLPAAVDGKALAQAVRRAVAHFGVILAGGDTVCSASKSLSLSVTAWGHLPTGEAAWTRAGARAGDALWVTGPLGGSRSGRHLQVHPRCDVVAALRGAAGELHAAMDLSDGLGRDLRRMCAASAVGATVFAERLPIHDDVGPDRDAVTAALGDGEDFELLLALPPGVAPPAGLDPQPVEIGQVTAGDELLLSRSGRCEALPDVGFEHVF